MGPEPDPVTTVEIELLGVARHLARRERIRLSPPGSWSLGELLHVLAREAPALVGTVLEADGALLGGHVLSRNGADLLRDSKEPIYPGDRLILFSISAGG